MSMRPPLLAKYALRLVLLAAVYYAAARLGLRYASVGQSISLVWPPTGIAIAALTLMGTRYFPAVFAGALLANAATPVSLVAALGIALGNTLEAVVAATLIRRRTDLPFRFDNIRHVRHFILLVVPVACLISAAVGVASLALSHNLERSFGAAVLVWWCGDALGALVVAPAFFGWAGPGTERTTRVPLVEILALVAGSAILGEIAFGDYFSLPLLRQVDYPYLLFPLVIWAAVRFGARGASFMTLALAVVAVSHTVAGGGPFVSPTPAGTLFALSIYLGLVAITGLVLAATIEWERKTATDALRESESRLHRMQRMEAVGRLAGGVAHETNNQMNVVLGAAEFILRRPDLPAPIQDDVQHIRSAAERTAAITTQLLAFGRRQLLKSIVLNLNAIVAGWEPLIRRAIGEDCTVQLRLSDQVGPIKADPGQLEQVLLNLILNARDAMPDGGNLTIETFRVEITARSALKHADAVMAAGGYAVLTVSDSGHGMSAETMGHAFEPFFTTKEIGTGTGLGLATVYGIVKQSNGYIWVYSEPGKGTTFKIYLPEVADQNVPQAPPPASLPRAAGETVLVVEDEASVRTMLRRTLEEAGYRVIETESADGALRIVRTPGTRIHLVVTDIVMPGMNGRELGEQLAYLVPGTPILYTSGYTDSEIARRGLLDPGRAFLQKPFSPDIVVRRVAELLQVRPDIAQSRQGAAPSEP